MNNGIQPSWIPDSAYTEGYQVPLFSIGKLNIQTYSLTMTLGILASILTVFIFWHREKYKIEIFLTLILITVPTALIGARLGWIIQSSIYEPGSVTWSNWYKSWEGGLSIQGGVAVSALCDLIYLYTKREIIDLRKAAGIILPAVLIGQVIGRWGNFANHELYGRIDWSGKSSLIFGHTFASNMYIKDSLSDSLGLPGAYRYPLFLYEGIANLIGYIIIVWVINWFGLLKPGVSGGLYFIWYGVVRFTMEPFRQYSYNIFIFIAFASVVFGTYLLIKLQFFNSIHYLKEWRKIRFIYQYAHPDKYVEYIEKTKFSKLFNKKQTNQ